MVAKYVNFLISSQKSGLGRIFFRISVHIFAFALLGGCAQRDRVHTILVSVPDQKMRVFERERLLTEYPVSTSKFGLGNLAGSNATPLGRLRVRQKIGDGAPLGAVFKSRRRTGEILRPNTPGRDPIVSRILWLDGLEHRNRNSFARTIYIHGTPEESRIGTPASYGCVRMKSADVIALYDIVGLGADIEIVNTPLPALGPPKNEVVSVTAQPLQTL